MGKTPEKILVYDEFDKQIVEERMFLINGSPLPMAGEFVLRSDGDYTRISYVMGAQAVCVTTTPGSYYLGLGTITSSINGHPVKAILLENLESTEDTIPADIWFFHHDTHLQGDEITRIVYLRIWKEIG